VLKGYVQGAGGPNHYPIYRPLGLLGIDACIYRDMLKWNKSSFLQKLVAAWMRILLTFLISNVSWVLANITSESSHCFRKGNRNSGHRLCIMVCPSFWEDYYMLIYTHCWELMNSVGSHGSSSMPFVMKVMVCHFVSDSHEVMTALIVVLPSIVVVEISLQLHRSLLSSIVIWVMLHMWSSLFGKVLEMQDLLFAFEFWM
jgi:hypothetical protein